MPAFAYIIVTEKLSDEQRASIGWAGREGIEDGRNFMHFYRLTPDGRLLVGGGRESSPTRAIWTTTPTRRRGTTSSNLLARRFRRFET